MEVSITKEMCSLIEKRLDKNVGKCILQTLSLLLPSRFNNQKSKYKIKST